MRIFLGHPKSWEDARIDSTAAELRRSFPGHEVTTGRDEYNRSGKTSGGWKGWIQRVGAGVGLDGHPLYSVIAIPEEPIGKATAEIAQLALARGRHLLVVRDGRWVKGKAVSVIDPQSFTEHAEIET